MAHSSTTEDYYMILGVEQTAATQIIISSYRRLALKLHPDRNAKHDATEAFQRLGRAYETLKDESKRKAYDLIYPSITRRRSAPQRTSDTPPTPTSQSDAQCEAAQVAAIQKSKQERSARWQTKKKVSDSSIFELQRSIRRLEREITTLVTILAAEATVEAQKNTLYKRAEDNEEEKERKDRARQERRIEKDLKERRLDSMKAGLKTQEDLLDNEQEKVDMANRRDDEKIRAIRVTMRAREDRERRERERQRQETQRQERERQERERQEKQRQERERQEKERQKERAAAQKRESTSNFQKRYAHPHTAEASASQDYTSACRHDGWWPKVQGRTSCPRCYESWTYLLQCPGCTMKACPKCQAAVRPRVPRNTARPNGTIPRWVRTPSPDYDSYYDW
ncbi:hypothetical protein E8E13_001003 [Curvularia kusanoi]|uniref:J domain-containing protein n=1 Tax=Curvularia kusanoi TaxID=90978 RepID=A0A9P4TF92_CURKU|nr:hypothetical protein E8E13_001003 [Curvularia kusanoi]